MKQSGSVSIASLVDLWTIKVQLIIIVFVQLWPPKNDQNSSIQTALIDQVPMDWFTNYSRILLLADSKNQFSYPNWAITELNPTQDRYERWILLDLLIAPSHAAVSSIPRIAGSIRAMSSYDVCWFSIQQRSVKGGKSFHPVGICCMFSGESGRECSEMAPHLVSWICPHCFCQQCQHASNCCQQLTSDDQDSQLWLSRWLSFTIIRWFLVRSTNGSIVNKRIIG